MPTSTLPALRRPTGTTTAVIPADWNDRISSIPLGTQGAVAAGVHGQRIRRHLRGAEADATQLPGNLNDNISSFRIPAPGGGGQPTPVTPAATEVCFYADFDFAGAAFCVPMDDNCRDPGGLERQDLVGLSLAPRCRRCRCALQNGFAGTCEVPRRTRPSRRVTSTTTSRRSESRRRPLRPSSRSSPRRHSSRPQRSRLSSSSLSCRPRPSRRSPPPQQPPEARVPGANEVCFYADFGYGERRIVLNGVTEAALGGEWNDRFSRPSGLAAELPPSRCAPTTTLPAPVRVFYWQCGSASGRPQRQHLVVPDPAPAPEAWRRHRLRRRRRPRSRPGIPGGPVGPGGANPPAGDPPPAGDFASGWHATACRRTPCRLPVNRRRLPVNCRRLPVNRRRLPVNHRRRPGQPPPPAGETPPPGGAPPPAP